MRTMDDITSESLQDVAKKMLVAARTAPKARGTDHTFLAIVEGDEITRLADAMKKIGQDEGLPSFIRDAENIRPCRTLVLLGTRIRSLGLKKCGFCGFENCDAKSAHPDVPCAFNTGDLGIAIGSAVATAMDHRIDNRIMYSVGLVARQIGLLPPDIRVAYGIPLSASAKNPFFDRN